MAFPISSRVFFFSLFQSIACLLALAVLSTAEEEKKADEDLKTIETEQLEDKKQEKRGIHDYGDWSRGHHEEKTLTIVKKIPVPIPNVKTVHVPHYKEVHVPVKVGIPKPYPVVKHVSFSYFVLNVTS